MNDSIRVMFLVLSVGAGVLVAGAQNASTPMPTLEQTIAVQEGRVKDIAREMMVLDDSIDTRIGKIIGDLKKLQDSADSGTKVTFMKEDTLKRLGNTVRWYQSERARRVAAMRTGSTFLTKEQLTNDIARIETKIEERVADIMGLTDSFQKQTDFTRSNYYDGISDETRHNRRVGSRTENVHEKVGNALDADARKLEAEISRLKSDLPYKQGHDRELIEQQIRNDEELVRKRKEQADLAGDGSAGAQARKVGGKEAYNFEKELKEDIASIKADLQKLDSLRNKFDVERVNLNKNRALLKQISSSTAL